MELRFFPMPHALCPMPGSQLPASGRDILPLAPADDDGIVSIDQNILKPDNGVFIRPLKRAAFVGIKRDKIDF